MIFSVTPLRLKRSVTSSISSTESRPTGMGALADVVSGTIVLLGPSGAGKSTLGNHLLDQDLLTTGAVRVSDGKGRRTTASQPAGPRQIRHPRTGTPPHPRARVLDLASGSGETLCTWARDLGFTGTGVDISTLFTEQARARAVKLGVADRVEFVHGDASGSRRGRDGRSRRVHRRHVDR